MRVYLAGPISGCTDAEARDWRAYATSLHYDVLDPMARDYRGREDEAVDEIVEGDKADINASDAVLAYCPRPSVGTSMEILYCYERGKPCVVVIPPNAPVSPWLTYHALHVTQTIEEGVALLRHVAPS